MSFMKEFEHLKIHLEEIKRATNNFRNEVIGAGGFGSVYEGEVSHSRGRSIVAIKRLNRQFGQGGPEYMKEIVMLSRYTHQNLVSLLGFCDGEGEKILVYEFASKRSLDRHLSDPDLTWVQRIKICLGAAKGLSYLHDPKGGYQRVLHCDIKSANILLDESLTAKVADFGLSKMGPANEQYSLLVTSALGTAGYCDPLFITTYTLTKESDVYSFGVVLFEVLCGRLCYEYSNGQVNVFVNMWKEKYSENKLDQIVFLDQQMDPTSLRLFSDVAFQCLHNSREGRPAMSMVVEKLEKALEFQEFYDLNVPNRYKKIVSAAVPPLRFTSIDDLNELLSKGFYMNSGNTWFSRNDRGEHYVLISLAECIVPKSDFRLGYCDNDSRFKVGSYSSKYGWSIRTRAKTQFLSPLITYTVNLVFKYNRRYKGGDEYLSLKYKLNGKEKFSIVHHANKREDEWLKASLYQFTSNARTVDLEIYFHNHYDLNGLKIEGIEFQPLEKVMVEPRKIQKYRKILKAAAYPLIFGSKAELNALLSKGVFLNEGKTWFSRNDKGVHYVFKSIQECLIQEAGESYNYVSGFNSRFPAGSYDASKCRFKACVKTEFLSRLMTYTVNLVFKFKYQNETAAKQAGVIWLVYKLDGETYTQVSHFAHKREDNWWTVELYHFTSYGTTTDLEIIFEQSSNNVIVDGIEFQPLGEEELEVLEDDQKSENLEQTLLDSEDDTYWKNKLPTDYKDIIKFSERSLRWTTNKELYYILSGGVMINHKPYVSFFQRTRGQQWFCLDKNGKTCLTLPARAVCRLKTPNLIEEGKSCLTLHEWKALHEWKSVPESRFGEGLVNSSSDAYKYIVIKENKIRVLSPQTKYACYLVYISERCGCTSPMLVWHQDLRSSEWESGSHIYLVGPKTPVITPKAGQNTHNPLYRPKLKGIPRQRSNGWMEVQIWEFQTGTTMTVIPSLRLEYQGPYLKGLIIIVGVEFRPI